MAIKGLTHREPQFPQIGQLRKGFYDKEKKKPTDLDYFRFTSDIPEVVEAFVSAYGEEPRLINVRLPHKTTDENWEAWYEEYVASGLIHRCDGEYVVRFRNRATGKYEDPEYGTMKCPYHSGEVERTEKRPGCKQTGRLQVIIPELRRLAYVMVLTGSKNDIMHLDGQLRALESLNGSLTGIPMQLRRRPEKISTPKLKQEDGKWVETAERARRESWLLSIEAAPSYVDLQIEAQEYAALPDVPKQLESGEEQWAIVEEPDDIVEAEEEGPEEVTLDGELAKALEAKLHKDTRDLGLKAGQSLLEAVTKGEDAKGLVEYLSRPSSYESQTDETTALQQAAALVFAYWDTATEMAGKGGVTEANGNSQAEPVEEGGDKKEQTPLF